MAISFQILNIQQARTINSTRQAPLSGKNTYICSFYGSMDAE
uniref:Uncharacterized protein n=1 Tax=Parascaris equorum TaxID=6256 RepID=A0A914RK98_PAREQ